MTKELYINFIWNGVFMLYVKVIPLLFVVLTLNKLLRYASGWQPSQHKHDIPDVA